MVKEIRFSIDDGDQHDWIIKELLDKYGFKGIFYIAPYYRRKYFKIMSDDKIRKISDDGHEIAGHTLTHALINICPIDKACREVLGGKKLLEEIIGKKITKFCPPRGYYNNFVKKIVKNIGFEEMRTMKNGITDRTGYDQFEIPISAQIYPRKEYQDKGIVKSITDIYLEADKKENGYFNLAMHGWEIEQMGLWSDLVNILKFIRNHEDKTAS